MDDFFTAYQEYFLIFLEPSVLLITGLLTFLVTKNSSKDDTNRDRLIYAYHPIFLAAEPFLFKSIEKQSAKLFLKKYNEVELKYSLYIYPSLRYRVGLLSDALKIDYEQSTIDEHWMLVCKYIEKDYDRLCKVSHMPIRSTAYRLNNNQFSSKVALYWGMFKLFFLPLTSFYIIWFLLLLLIGFKGFLSK